VGLRNSRPRRRRLLLGIVFAAALGVLGWSLPRAGTALIFFHPLDGPDVIVVLASHEWERLPQAAALARQYTSAVVLLTVPLVVTDSNCHLCAERTRWLTDLGLAPERILTLPERVGNTYDEARAARIYAERHDVQRLAVVTSPYHTRRALGTFQVVFSELAIQIGVYPACGSSPARPKQWWASGYDRAYVAYEWAANLQYRVKYGIPLVGPDSRSLAAGLCSGLVIGVPRRSSIRNHRAKAGGPSLT
jgi:uncharacterized SAM-binding protein YcdF (DUF218 family)